MRAPGQQNGGATVERHQEFGARGGGKKRDQEEHTGGSGEETYTGGECDVERTLGVEKRSRTGCINRAGGKARGRERKGARGVGRQSGSVLRERLR